MIPQRLPQKILATAFVGLGFAGLMSSPANAETESMPENLTYASIDMNVIENNTEEEVATFEATDPDSKVSDYLDSQARQGNLVDIEDVRRAQIPDPLTEGEIELVWVDGLEPSQVNRSEMENEAGNQQSGFGVAVDQDADRQDKSNNDPLFAGMGYASAEPNGMYLQSNDCWNGYFDPFYASESGNHHHMVSCYEKWAESGTTNWAYNRWGLWSRASGIFPTSSRTIDYTIRSRPWEGNESYVTKLNDWVPRSPSTECTSGGNTFSLTYGGAGINVPINSCEDTQVYPGIGTHSMGIGWNGSSSAQQMGLDFAMNISATNTTIVPVFADYNWAEVRFCAPTCVPGLSPSYKYLHNDAGWSPIDA